MDCCNHIFRKWIDSCLAWRFECQMGWLSKACAGWVLLSVSGWATEWHQENGYRFTQLPPVSGSKPGFTSMPASSTGVGFSNYLALDRMVANVNLANGSGVALGDFDGDGLCDIYLCNLGGSNALYKNLGGWKFQDVTAEAGVACTNQSSTGAVFADLDGDGWLDLLVTSLGGPNACFHNDGHGHFENVTEAAGLTSRLGSTTMALADIDGNGTLDLYVANYGATSILRSGGALNISYVNGKPVVHGRYAQRLKFIDGIVFELGEPAVLYLNDGRGKFTPVSWIDGTFLDENGKPLAQAPWDQGLTVAFRDLNGDGSPDIYACNDTATPDRFWINDGHGHFRAAARDVQRSTSYFSMGADFGDLDRDGFDDFFIVDMMSRSHGLRMTQRSLLHHQPRIPGDINAQFQIRRNTLFHNRGDGTYAEIANYSGLSASDWSWSCIFLDVDLDGWEDILISNGFPLNPDDADLSAQVKGKPNLSVEELRKFWRGSPRLVTPDFAFRNQHDLTFREVGKDWGFDSPEISNGMALADLDGDGDLDVVVNCLNGQALILRNNAPAPRLGVRLKGRTPNTRGIGAKIKVLGGPVTQTQEMMAGGRYMSSDDMMRVFAAGNSTQLTIEVTWRSGAKSVVSGAKPNSIYEIDEVGAQPAPSKLSPAGVATLFEDVSSQLEHHHHQEEFDDYARQPLLPKKLSQLGPGVAWFDFGNNGRDDLVLGAARNGTPATFRYTPDAGFKPIPMGEFGSPSQHDLASVLALRSGGSTTVLAAEMNYVDAATNSPAVAGYEFGGSTVTKQVIVSGQRETVGPMAVGDIEGGHLAMFVGGRVIPGHYPIPASSRLYNLEGKNWVLDAGSSAALKDLGLASGCVWSDLDGDGFPELIVAFEWGSIRVYKYRDGKLTEITADLGLANHTGWWTSVTTGDFDGDGRMDIVAGNWGLNSSYTATPAHPARLYYGDWNEAGGTEILEAEDDETLGIVPRRDLTEMAGAMPWIAGKYNTHASFAAATIAAILEQKLGGSKQLQAATLASTIFFNRGDHFDAVPLPPQAQWAPVFGLCVGDFDGDGIEDLFLGQNFFETEGEIPRLDGGRGLMLRGTKEGKLQPMPGQASGIKLYGEQRGAAVADYDGDGRPDLVVTQNGGNTGLFHNRLAKPGLRVRLRGPESNPDGIGAQMRLVGKTVSGPARELHLGGGYWSQDSHTQVLSLDETPLHISVRWPGGKTVLSDIPPDSHEIIVGWDGQIRVER